MIHYATEDDDDGVSEGAPCARCGERLGDGPIITIADDGPDFRSGHYHPDCLTLPQ